MTKSLVQQQFGANAAAYAVSKIHAKGASLALLVDLVCPSRDWRALDVATGAGHTAAAFAPRVSEVIASDITPEMLEQAKKLAVEKGLSNMTTALADAEALPFADSSFDLVTCRIAPHHFPDVPRFVAEVRRVLMPGGTFALVDNVTPSEETTAGFSASDLSDAAAGYNAFEKLRDPSHGRALSTPEWRKVVAEAGLAVRHTEHLEKAMEFETWCRTMSVPPDVVLRLEAMLDRAPPALSAFLRPTRDGDGRIFVLTELVMIATRPPASQE